MEAEWYAKHRNERGEQKLSKRGLSPIVHFGIYMYSS